MRLLLFALALFGPLPAARAGFINGDFQTGDFTGWTTFTTAIGSIGTPAVVSFDTTGSGASLAAQFQVGRTDFLGSSQEGGGIFQSVVVSTPGHFELSVDIAAEKTSERSNGEGGVFTLLLDGVAVDSHAFGPIAGNTTLRSSLGATVNLSAGAHEFRVLITRPARAPDSLYQYVDNARFEQLTAVPEPSSLALLSAGGGSLAVGWLQRPGRRGSGEPLAGNHSPMT